MVESSFNDRRGQNPYAPRDSRYARTEQPQKFVIDPNDSSYNGRGTRNPNGSQPASMLNGRSLPREDPDLAGRKRALQRLGAKAI